MWRHDAARSAESPGALPDNVQLLWTRDLPPLKPAFRTPRLHFDAGYEPIVLGQRLFIASSYNDSVTAFDTKTGRELWRFHAAGPVRFAPVAWNDRLAFGADDGNVYCLSAASGELIWKMAAAPTSRKVLGNGRLISLWPVRGGPVLHEDKLYFAAGVWSFEGVFIYCVDANSGEVIWRNDDSGNVYGIHPHGAEAFGGVTPQGYLVIQGDDLIVPCGQAYPAVFDRKTGELTSFELPAPGRVPGSYFASADVRRGEVVLDEARNRDLHEDKVYQGAGMPGVRTTITVGDRKLSFEDAWEGVEGDVHSLVAADEKLFVVTVAGRMYCFGARQGRALLRHEYTPKPISLTDSASAGRLRDIVQTTQGERGYAVVWQAPNLEWLLQLCEDTEFQLIVIESNVERVDNWRRALDEYGLYGQRIVVVVGEPGKVSLPPYLASLVIAEQVNAGANVTSLSDLAPSQFELLRPYGGTAMLALSPTQHASFEAALRQASTTDFTVERGEAWTIVRRNGGLKGAVNYTGGWASPDEHVRAPLGVLWFDDALGHFKRSPQPWFVDGVMISLSKDWMERHRANRKPPYDLLPPVLSDVFTGRILDTKEAMVTRLQLPERDRTGEQPSQYRPPTQLDAWKPKQPIVGERINPLTGQLEPRAIPKSYGCDGGVDYGNFYTMRSGTPAFYDKRLESGVCNISGPRSGCTNSIIPACGVLNVPYFYEGCTCSYPLPAGLAMMNMPPEHEQWASWGPGAGDNIEQVGINFGAPGDRMTESGTLWLEYPMRGGASPDVRVRVEPASATYYYRHALWMREGQGWPWVAASGVQGASTVTIEGLKPGQFTVRLYFAEPDDTAAARRFDVSINDRLLLPALDVADAARGSRRGIVKEFDGIECDGTITVKLTSRTGQTILGGIELIAADRSPRN